MLFVGCLTSQQHASVSQGRICSDNLTRCHTEIEVADQIFYLTQSQCTDTGPTSPSADPITPGAWQGSHWSHWYDSTTNKSWRKRDSNPGSSALEADSLPLCQRGGFFWGGRGGGEGGSSAFSFAPLPPSPPCSSSSSFCFQGKSVYSLSKTCFINAFPCSSFSFLCLPSSSSIFFLFFF